MAWVTVNEGQRVAYGAKTYAAGASFDAGDFADSLVARGLATVKIEAESESPAVPEPQAENKPEPDAETSSSTVGSGAPIVGKRFARRPRV